MRGIIEVKNLSFKNKDKIVFKNLNLEIKKNAYTTIIGSNDSGKTLLSKIILGLVQSEAEVRIDGTILNKYTIDNICDTIEYIPGNSTDAIIMDSVKDEILFNTDNVDKKYLDELLELVGLTDKLKENPKNLSYGEKQLMYFVSCLIRKPTVIVCDEAFSLLDNLVKDKILKYLKKISKERKVTVINFTNDSEDILYGEYVAIIANHKIVFNDKKEELYDSEKLFKKLGFHVPFMIELSNKLKYYDLLNKVEIDMNRMINKIWK